MIMEKPTTQTLVDTLKAKGNLTDPQIEEAFFAVPRHYFVPDAPLEQVYANTVIPVRFSENSDVTCEATMPSVIDRLLTLAQLEQGQNVLHIGTGTGYTAALVRHLIGENGNLTTIEIERDIANAAQNNLLAASVMGVTVVNADGAEGYAPRAAYDRIIVTAGVWDMPTAWIRQLKPNGRIVVPIWLDGLQVMTAFALQPDGSLFGDSASPSSYVYIRGLAAGPMVRKFVGSTALSVIADEVDKIDTAALHSLLSDDAETDQLTTPLNKNEYWYGFLPYMMLHESPNHIFALYDVREGQRAYGIEGRGFALFTPASACFVPYFGEGFVQNFASADAFLAVERYLQRWQTAGRPRIDNVRLRLIPQQHDDLTISSGKLYTRKDHCLHVWFEQADDDSAL
jgi:protein-L-isoaspartate(D-aspartate) O-methyltransferase